MDNKENNSNNKVSLLDQIITIIIVISLIIILTVGITNKTKLEALYIDLDLESESIEFSGSFIEESKIVGCKIIHNKKIKSFNDFNKEIPHDSLSLLKQYVSSKTESITFKFTHIYEVWNEFLGVKKYYTILQIESDETEDTILVTIPLNKGVYNAIAKEDAIIIVHII